METKVEIRTLYGIYNDFCNGHAYFVAEFKFKF